MKERQLFSDRTRVERTILAAAANDLEPFEAIASKVAHLPGLSDWKELSARMLQLIADGRLGAYLLHAEPPCITPVEVSADTLATYWFHITERGAQFLQEAMVVEGAAAVAPAEMRESA